MNLRRTWHLVARTIVPELCLLLTTACGTPQVVSTAMTVTPTGSAVPTLTPTTIQPTARCGAVLQGGQRACPLTVTPATPATLASPRASPGATGYLAGHATIGPLQPVERPGQQATPPPAVCTARALTVLTADGLTAVTTFNLQPDCTFRVALAPGTYVIRLAGQQNGPGRARNLPQTIQIAADQTTNLDVGIDTGIR
jgi:hypothetical protein